MSVDASLVTNLLVGHFEQNLLLNVNVFNLMCDGSDALNVNTVCVVC